MALALAPGQILARITAQGARLTAMGLLLGLPLAFCLALGLALLAQRIEALVAALAAEDVPEIDALCDLEVVEGFHGDRVGENSGGPQFFTGHHLRMRGS